MAKRLAVINCEVAQRDGLVITRDHVDVHITLYQGNDELWVTVGEESARSIVDALAIAFGQGVRHGW